MVGPPSECEQYRETMQLSVQWLRIGEPCKTVPIGLSSSSSLHNISAAERLGARAAYGSPGPPARLRLAQYRMADAKPGANPEAVLCA
jgi:hypothetical protein